jgi:ribonuclease HII
MPSKDSFLRKLECTTQYEEMAYKYGATRPAGIDECARGNWAGVTCAGCCILPRELPESLAGKLRDSKLLSARKRAALAEEIKKCAIAWHVAVVSVEVIDEINIRNAAIMAMEESVHGLSVLPDFLLIDAVKIDLPVEQLAIEHGDALSVSIAAASILAKTHHTELMAAYDAQYPGYGFAKHKGYGTKEHMEAIERLGVTPIHRRSFAPIKEFIARGKVFEPAVLVEQGD